jgi:uncharacterized membrane protein YhaH (DUF805 family)
VSLFNLLFSFRGRIRRLPYWMFGIAALVVFIAVAVFASMTAVGEQHGGRLPLWLDLVFLIYFYPATAVTVKRTNDIGWSPIWAYMLMALIVVLAVAGIFEPFGPLQNMASGNLAMIAIATVFTAVVSIIIGCIPGTNGANRHGPSPLASAQPS